ncbi:uncharacterized protein STEHIDRAFT_173254 [Stereum hirsutum FP-91666 SS1]|uniref:Uncharacterized protein n=1 Tax=Stereum hirsutum (strain FP-91666) TaxID=721885 RepID=R7RVJ0_STEHR|nr:uncharacterized protein STEHIDRAFT_173254 [Stereum hirsutum FP-91666 SS1]EIM79039.1 hypothetical protein STEHIDRAFT_173254 [Stereum hirsutum FP-91666 SS1]
MYPLQAIQNCTERKRRREDVDSPDEPPAKRHHQRHLTATPSKRKARLSTKPALSTQRRYSLRATAERARSNIANDLAHIPVAPAPLPIPTPVPAPILPTTRIPTKRPRNALEADICEEPPAKRHHQRHLTSPPKRRTRSSTRATAPTQSRYSLRTTADRVRRNTAATLAHNSTVVPPITAPTPAQTPIVSPPPVLAKRRRLTVEDDFDVDVSEEPHAKRHRLAPSPSKHASDSSTRPDIAIQSRYFLRMTTDRIRRNIAVTPPHIPAASPCIPVQTHPCGSTPTPEFVTIPASTFVDAPVAPSARTSDRVQAHRIPIQASNTAATPLPLQPLANIPTRPPVDISATSATSAHTHVPWEEVPGRERTRLSAMWDKLIIRVWGGYSMFELGGLNAYARALGLSSCDKPDDLITHAVLVKYPELVDIVGEFRDDFTKLYKYCDHPAFFNALDAPIDAALAEIEPLFMSYRLPYFYDYFDPFSVDNLAVALGDRWEPVADTFEDRKPYKTMDPEPQTLTLVTGVGTHWGFYFAYSPNKTTEEVCKSNLSQDLLLATQELGATVDTASLSPEAISCRTAAAERCFYALYLTRIIVLSRFLEFLPKDLDDGYHHACWAVFQRNPPRTSEGDDVFSVVYRQVARARGSIAELRRTAETRFETLVERNKRLFVRLNARGARYPPRFPFYLAVDEVEAPTSPNLLSGRRPACSRFGVSALFYGFDTPLEFDFIGCTWPLRLPNPASVKDTARAACSPETQPPSVVLSCSALLPTSWATIPHCILRAPL